MTTEEHAPNEDIGAPLTREDLNTLTPAEIINQFKAGKLAHLTGQTPPTQHEGPLTRADLKDLTPAELNRQYQAGNLNHLI